MNSYEKVPRLRLVYDTSPKKSPARTPRSGADVYVIKVTLLGTKPPVWRRLAVRADTTLARLHSVLQSAIGWYDCHLHQVVAPDQTRYSALSPDGDLDWDSRVVDERKVKLRQVLRASRQRMVYEYDFGDGWEHRIELEKIVPPEPGEKLPRCLGGRRSCPPEDCGGVWGYAEMLRALADPKHREHAMYKEWLDGDFDAEAFDIERVNELLAGIR